MFLLAVCTALLYFAASLQLAASGAEPELPSYATAKTFWPNHKKIKGLQTDKNNFVLRKNKFPNNWFSIQNNIDCHVFGRLKTAGTIKPDVSLSKLPTINGTGDVNNDSIHEWQTTAMNDTINNFGYT